MEKVTGWLKSRGKDVTELGNKTSRGQVKLSTYDGRIQFP